ncbi:MAG TPA: quinone oxidoreductase [Egibacteraceae bacterium]|nr:quinone oxidoreductase [Egibacteraceae bacterium]
MHAVLLREAGDPEVLHLEEVDDPLPGPGQAVVRVEAAGLNFIDTYQRSGAYPLDLPTVIGSEGAGVVETLGEGVVGLSAGDRVAWAGQPGSYAERVVVDVGGVVTVPDGVDTRTAAAVMLQGMTAHYLALSTFALGPDHTALVHAAAGGVGHLLVQIAKRRGAEVVATVSTEEKAEIAREAGADEVIRYTEVDFAEETARLYGRGMDVVYDSVGKATFLRSMDCLRPRGVMVLFGQSSGKVDPVDPQVLNTKGSLYLTRPTLAHYTADPTELRWRAGDLFGWIAAGQLAVRVDRTFSLAEAADAHRYIEGRQTKGKVLLLPVA